MMAPTDPMMTTQRQPDRPNGASGLSTHASRATSGTGMKPMDCCMAKVLPRARLGTSSEMKVSTVTSSTPMPMPAMRRQRLTPAGVFWNAMTSVATQYQTRE